MYGTSKNFEPEIYIALSILITLLISFFIVEVFSRVISLKDKIPSNYSQHGTFFVCGLLILIPQLLRIYTSTIEGGGVSHALKSYTAPITIIASIVLFVTVIKLFKAIKPEKKFSDLTSQSTKG